MKMKSLLAVLLGIAVPLGACQTVANIAQTASASTPMQATTLVDAVQMADLATNAVDVYVTTGTPTRVTIDRLQMIRATLRADLDALIAANSAKQSLVFVAFNAAYANFQTYYNGVKK
jgi:hypothetical protein